MSNALKFTPRGGHITVLVSATPEGGQAVSSAGRPDFNRILRVLGVHTTVVVETVRLPAPPVGARLIAGPSE